MTFSAARTAGSSVAVRLWSAAGLCVLSLGLTWSVRAGSYLPGSTLQGVCDGNGYCAPDVQLPGYSTPATRLLAADAPVRVLIVAAAIALVLCAVHPRTPTTRRIARLGTLALAAIAVLALGQRATPVLLCALAALALVFRPVWGSRRRAHVVGTVDRVADRAARPR